MTGGIGAVALGQIVRRNFDISFEGIQEHEQAARECREELNATEAVGRLQQENDQLKLCLASLVALLLRKHVITKNELRRFAEAVDQADGVADGRFSGSIHLDGSLSAQSSYDDLALRELAKVVESIG